MQNDVMEPKVVVSRIRATACRRRWPAGPHLPITSAARDDKNRNRDGGGTVPSPFHRIGSLRGCCPGVYERVGDLLTLAAVLIADRRQSKRDYRSWKSLLSHAGARFRW
jgi:hypothetical protein